MTFLIGTGRPNLRLGHHVFDAADLWDVPATHPFLRAEGVGPLSVALEFTGAAMVPQNEFRMMDANGDLE